MRLALLYTSTPCLIIANVSLSSLFQYDKLPSGSAGPHVRLLELLPGRDEADPIRCRLHVVPLERERDYEALSYCWGDPKSVGFIECDGAPFPIAANLMGALQALRREDTARLLWVDAICIHQDSVEERNQQVAIMRDIYRNARHTVIWLGPEGDRSSDAFDIIPSLLAIRRDKPIRGVYWGMRSRYTLSPGEVDANPELKRLIQNRDARTAFLVLVQRPWFSRVWVVQEATVSPHATIVCGAREVLFDDFTLAVLTFDALDLYPEITLRQPTDWAWEMWDTRRKHGDRWPNSLFQLLFRHRWCEATDQRDKVYALCGIASDGWAQSQGCVETEVLDLPPLPVVVYKPDYGASTVDVYTRLAVNFLASPHVGLDVFSAIHPSEPRLAGLPSWAPDWSASVWFYTSGNHPKTRFTCSRSK